MCVVLAVISTKRLPLRYQCFWRRLRGTSPWVGPLFTMGRYEVSNKLSINVNLVIDSFNFDGATNFSSMTTVGSVDPGAGHGAGVAASLSE